VGGPCGDDDRVERLACRRVAPHIAQVDRNAGGVGLSRSKPRLAKFERPVRKPSVENGVDLRRDAETGGYPRTGAGAERSVGARRG
jgi:hypothetical protein